MPTDSNRDLRSKECRHTARIPIRGCFIDPLPFSCYEKGETHTPQWGFTKLTFFERQEFVSAKVEELKIVIQALAECDDAISKLKANWYKPYRELYRSNELTEL